MNLSAWIISLYLSGLVAMVEELVEVLLVQLNLCTEVRDSRSVELVARGEGLFPNGKHL